MSTQIWTTHYPTNLDTASQQPVVENDVDDIDASHVNALASASQALQAKVGTNNIEAGSLLEHMGISNAYMSQTPLPKLVWQTTSSITVEDVDGVTQSKVALSDGKVRTLASGLSVALTNPNGPHGIDTGSPVIDRWYRNYLIPDPNDDDLLSVVSSLNAPATGPTGYSVNKYIGSMYRNGGGVLIEFDQTGPRFFIRRTDQRKTLLLWNDVTPPVVGSWVTIDAEGVYDIPPEICSSFTMTGGIDGDSGFCQISVTTDDGVPSYSPSGGSHGDVFLRFQGNMQESNTRDFPNIDGNVYYWVHAGVTDVVDMQLQLQAWEDKYLLEPVTTVSNPTLGEHAIGGPVHTSSTLAELNTKISDATLDSISDARTPATHQIAGAYHGASTFAQLNAKVSDATLVASSDSRLADARTPLVHAIAGVQHGTSTFSELNAKITGATLVESSDPRLTGDRDPTPHALGGAKHTASTLAELNALVSDATLDGASDTRTPSAHAIGGASHSASTLAALNALVSDATLVDAASTSTLPALGAVQTTGFTLAVDTINRVDISASSFTGTFPAAASATGKTIKILIVDNREDYELTLAGNGGELIDGVANVYLQAQACSEFYSDGTGWHWLKKGVKYIERGVVTSPDWSKGSLTEDFAWRSLSLTGIIPNAAKGKHIEFAIFFQGTSGNSLSLSGWNNTTQHNYLYVRAQVTGQGDRTTGHIPSTAAGAVYYRLSNSSAMNISVRGWWVDV